MTVLYERKVSRRYGSLQLDYSVKLTKAVKGFAFGTYSLCEDGKHVIYLDYDNFRLEWLLEELRTLRDTYHLSPFYIFQSSQTETGHYKHHAVCFDKVEARLYNQIVQGSNADMLFRNNGFFDFENARVLRFSAKSRSRIQAPRYYGKLSSRYLGRQKSAAHMRFYSAMFAIPARCIDWRNHDGKKRLNVISYMTKNIGER